ncbi:hypothetical protein [Haloarcula montana]|uniref:hypothetical protein n=1 Tax=Haloarcula montana TaxID=3111776 RepID=UPI002D78065B|nr:hypothetical protein [Haloarcula sp. GH36]
MSSDSDDPTPAETEAEMLPDERAAIAERGSDLDEMDDEEFLSIGELAEKLDFERQ